MSATAALDLRQAQDQFVKMLPDIESLAGSAFRGLDPETKKEAVAETVAQCWQNHLHCVEQGKSPTPSSMSYYALKSVKSGREMAGTSSTDVLSRRTQLLGRARVQNMSGPSMDARSGDGEGCWSSAEALVDRRVWERPFERVRIKLDYTKFLGLPEVTNQERESFSMLARGYGTREIAERLKVSPPRICQIKSSIGSKLVGFFGPWIAPAAMRNVR